jgi:hypothetical protein
MEGAENMKASRKGIGLGVFAAGLVCAFAYIQPASAAAPEMVKVHQKYAHTGGTAPADFLPTRDPNEANPAYAAGGQAWLYTQPYGGTGNTPAIAVAFRRCYKATSTKYHYINTGSGCVQAGDVNEGVLGYALTSARAGHVALRRCAIGTGTDGHWYVTDGGCGADADKGILGYVVPVPAPPPEASLSTGKTNDCMGRCGMGCNGWMPASLVGANIYTDQCLAHDQCVAQKGLLACMNGTFVLAAISYSVATDILIVRAIGDALKSVFHW